MSTPEQRMRMAKPDRRFRGPPRQEGTSPGLQASGLGRRRPLRGGRHQREIQQGSLRPSGGVDRGRRVRQAEELATEFIASDTDVVVTWSNFPRSSSICATRSSTGRTRGPRIRSTSASLQLGRTTTSSKFPFRSSTRRQLGLEHPPPYGSIGWVLPNCKGCGRSGRRRGLLDRILSFGGGFEPCFVRGSTTTLSNHSFGSAFDINVAWNEKGIARRSSARKARCASSFPSPTNGASGGAGISVRRTACISRWPC